MNLPHAVLEDFVGINEDQPRLIYINRQELFSCGEKIGVQKCFTKMVIALSYLSMALLWELYDISRNTFISSSSSIKNNMRNGKAGNMQAMGFVAASFNSPTQVFAEG